MKRMNLGCGSVQPEGWDNVDYRYYAQDIQLNVLDSMEVGRLHDYDYIVCNHMLSDIGHHDLGRALTNIRSMLKHGGVLRLMVPDVVGAFLALKHGDEGWFPQDERTGDIHAKFCTFVTWFGESKSVFTPDYLGARLMLAGFATYSAPLNVGQTRFGPSDITELDSADRRLTQIIVEAVK